MSFSIHPRTSLLILLALWLLVPIGAASWYVAQGQEASVCDASYIEAKNTAIGVNVGLLENANNASDYAALATVLRDALNEAIAACSEDAYEGVGQEVIGPVSVSGVNVVSFNAPDDGYNGVTVTELTGDCGTTLLFNSADPLEDARTVWEAGEDCQALIEVKSDAAWSISWTPVGGE
jgi:hypothetical protein